jgi:hypothetical protein
MPKVNNQEKGENLANPVTLLAVQQYRSQIDILIFDRS